MMTTPPTPPPPASVPTPKRVPPPCWTREETVALIKAYREKWYSLSRGNLRSTDWDAVAVAVSAASSNSSPKSSLQCRHKMEKLRKRYRTEKQRCVNYPDRFFSSWDLFPLLDFMEIASVASKPSLDSEFGDGYLVNLRNDENLDVGLDLDPDLAFRARKFSKINQDSVASFHLDTDFGNELGAKPPAVNYAMPLDGDSGANADFDCISGNGFGIRVENMRMDGDFVPPAVRWSGCGRNRGDFSPNVGNIGEGVDTYSAFPLKTLGGRTLGPSPRFKLNSYRKVDGMSSGPSFDGVYDDVNCGSGKQDHSCKKVVDDWSFMSPGFRLGKRFKDGVDSGVLNGYADAKMNGPVLSGHGFKRRIDPFADVVSSIQMLTEGYVNVERMKMEMAMEIEKMRMEMELKQNKMILESQQKLIDSLGKAISGRRKKRKGVEVLSPSSSRNGDSQVATTDCESIGKNSLVKEGEGSLI